MFSFNELKSVEFEISTKCQAQCPMCPRTTYGGIKNNRFEELNMSFDDFKKILDDDTLKQIEMVIFCGTLGEALMNDDLIQMCEYIKQHNSNMHVHIHTNGSLRNLSWWKKLYDALPKNHNVIFGIDGLADTHSIYRINTHFDNIIKNAKHFISLGGTATWSFIKFKHNEHQIDQARDLAREIGFKQFFLKQTRRFYGETKFPVKDEHKNVLYYLEPPSSSQEKSYDVNLLKDLDVVKNSLNKLEINCLSKLNKNISIDVNGNVFPCCYLRMVKYHFNEPWYKLSVMTDFVEKEFDTLLNDYKISNEFSAKHSSLRTILDSQKWNIWDELFINRKFLTCLAACGISDKRLQYDTEQVITINEERKYD